LRKSRRSQSAWTPCLGIGRRPCASCGGVRMPSSSAPCRLPCVQCRAAPGPCFGGTARSRPSAVGGSPLRPQEVGGSRPRFRPHFSLRFEDGRVWQFRPFQPARHALLGRLELQHWPGRKATAPPMQSPPGLQGGLRRAAPPLQGRFCLRPRLESVSRLAPRQRLLRLL